MPQYRHLTRAIPASSDSENEEGPAPKRGRRKAPSPNPDATPSPAPDPAPADDPKPQLNSRPKRRLKSPAEPLPAEPQPAEPPAEQEQEQPRRRRGPPRKVPLPAEPEPEPEPQPEPEPAAQEEQPRRRRGRPSRAAAAASFDAGASGLDAAPGPVPLAHTAAATAAAADSAADSAADAAADAAAAAAGTSEDSLDQLPVLRATLRRPGRPRAAPDVLPPGRQPARDLELRTLLLRQLKLRSEDFAPPPASWRKLRLSTRAAPLRVRVDELVAALGLEVVRSIARKSPHILMIRTPSLLRKLAQLNVTLQLPREALMAAVCRFPSLLGTSADTVAERFTLLMRELNKTQEYVSAMVALQPVLLSLAPDTLRHKVNRLHEAASLMPWSWGVELDAMKPASLGRLLRCSEPVLLRLIYTYLRVASNGRKFSGIGKISYICCRRAVHWARENPNFQAWLEEGRADRGSGAVQPWSGWHHEPGAWWPDKDPPSGVGGGGIGVGSGRGGWDAAGGPGSGWAPFGGPGGSPGGDGGDGGADGLGPWGGFGGAFGDGYGEGYGGAFGDEYGRDPYGSNGG